MKYFLVWLNGLSVGVILRAIWLYKAEPVEVVAEDLKGPQDSVLEVLHEVYLE